jgi:hypothetical protein
VNWDSDELRSAALRLLLLGAIRSTKVAGPLLAELEELGLVTPSTRKNEFLLLPQCKEKFRRYLGVRWPQLDVVESAFFARPETISAAALRSLRRLPLSLPAGVTQLNRRTWSAWAGAHSKSGYRTPPEGLLLTSDEVLRLRTNAGLQFVSEDSESLAADVSQRIFGELIVPERGLARNWRVSGVLPKLVLTVENIGAYIDLPVPQWLLLIHAPGRNTRLATGFIDRLPAGIPWVHFGDVDPAGLDIALSIHGHKQDRRPIPWIPGVASELLETHALPLDSPWPQHRLPPDLLNNPVLKWLVAHQRWLEHETAVLLPGFAEELMSIEQYLSHS